LNAGNSSAFVAWRGIAPLLGTGADEVGAVLLKNHSNQISEALDRDLPWALLSNGLQYDQTVRRFGRCDGDGTTIMSRWP